MGFFSGSSTSTVVPIPQLFDSGVFSDNKANADTRELALEHLKQLRNSPFFQSGNDQFGDLLKEQVNSLIGGESQISDNLRGTILDGAQSQFNKRGLNRITENEALSALAPFELSAQDQALKSIMGLVSGRQGDQALFQNLIAESRPDMLVGSSITNSTNPSGIGKITSLLDLGTKIMDFGKDVGSTFAGISGGGGGGGFSVANSPFSSGNSIQKFLKPSSKVS